MKAHAQNAPGDFYVEDQCCITCGIPIDIAPTVFDWADEPQPSHCIVKSQPRTADELTLTLGAMFAAEAACIRYRGADVAVVRRIAEMGMSDCSDEDVPAGLSEIVRDRVSFATTATPREMALRYRTFLQISSRDRTISSPLVFDDGRLKPIGSSVRFAWYERKFHEVTFEIGEHPGRLVAIARPNRSVEGARRGLAGRVGSWAKSEPDVSDVRWYSSEQWKAGGPWSAEWI